jgi:pimeloyl-ACP methyl ester carboxylesterase
MKIQDQGYAAKQRAACHSAACAWYKPGSVKAESVITVAGQRARIIEAGAGPAKLLLLASQLVLARSYRPTMQALAGRGFHVCAVEMPGCGGGAKLWRPWGKREYGRWVCALLDAMNPCSDGRPIVIGHSSSGAVAAVAAAACPHQFRALVLVDSIGALRVPLLPPVLLGRALDGLIEWKLSLRAIHHPFVNLFIHPRNLLRQIALSAETDLRGVAAALRVPTLIAWGRRDHTMPLESGRMLHRLITGSRLHVCQAGSHDWIVDHAEEFAQMIERFSSSCGS